MMKEAGKDQLSCKIHALVKKKRNFTNLLNLQGISAKHYLNNPNINLNLMLPTLESNMKNITELNLELEV